MSLVIVYLAMECALAMLDALYARPCQTLYDL